MLTFYATGTLFLLAIAEWKKEKANEFWTWNIIKYNCVLCSGSLTVNNNNVCNRVTKSGIVN